MLDSEESIVRVEYSFASCSFDAVLFAADDPDFNLEDRVVAVALLEELLSDDGFSSKLDRGAIPHVGLEVVRLARGRALIGDREQQRTQPVVGRCGGQWSVWSAMLTG